MNFNRVCGSTRYLWARRRYIVTHLSKIVYFPMIIVCKVLTAAHKLAVNKEGVNWLHFSYYNLTKLGTWKFEISKINVHSVHLQKQFTKWKTCRLYKIHVPNISAETFCCFCFIFIHSLFYQVTYPLNLFLRLRVTQKALQKLFWLLCNCHSGFFSPPFPSRRYFWMDWQKFFLINLRQLFL